MLFLTLAGVQSMLPTTWECGVLRTCRDIRKLKKEEDSQIFFSGEGHYISELSDPLPARGLFERGSESTEGREKHLATGPVECTPSLPSRVILLSLSSPVLHPNGDTSSPALPCAAGLTLEHFFPSEVHGHL